MMQQQLEAALKEVDNTTALVSKFVKFLQQIQKTKQSEEAFNDALDTFKELYKGAPYYNDVKESIIEEVSMLGIDIDIINQHL
jgi:hypothetical protein